MNSTVEHPLSVAVIGSGAIGGFLAAQAEVAGNRVTLCVRTPISSLVIRMAGIEQPSSVTIATNPGQVGPADWILVATKAQDTPSIEPWLRRTVGAGSVVVAIQNGLDHIERLRPLVDDATPIIPALIYVAAERIRPGYIVHRSGRQLVVPDESHSGSFERLFRGSLLEIQQTADFRTASWQKLLTNVAANPITALTLRRMDVFQDPDVQALARTLLQEGVRVAQADGALLGPHDIQSVLERYLAFGSEGGTSMLYDRLAARTLEYEALTGAVVERARKYGVATPLHHVLLTLLRVAAPCDAVKT